NQQHRLNGFEYGLDNWVYGANGDSGGNIQNPGRTSSPFAALNHRTGAVNLSGRDFRFRPDTGEFEAVAGQTQYGRHRDDWGNWFGNNNPTWLWHYYLPEHYLARNPHLSVRATKQMLANYPESTRLYPASRTRQRFNDPSQFNHVTSGNSPTPYRDELFGPDFATSVFISDPVHNVVHREVLEPNGISFTSHRASDEARREFLASADNWFRPTMLKTGPDGALYIADMYRQVLEHPEWIPAHILPRLDLRAGADQGRLYRVYPTGATLRKIPRLDQLDTAGLVAALDSPNGWQRDTAQRLLVHSGDPSAIAPLKKLLEAGSRPKARLQALCTLEGLGAVTPEIVRMACKDPQPQVRAHGLRVSEQYFVAPPAGGQTSDTANHAGLSTALPPEGARRELADFLLRLADDPDIGVRYQLAFTLGEWKETTAGSALVGLALRDLDVAPLQTAVLSSAPRHVGEMLQALLARRAQAAPPEGLLAELLGLATSMRNQQAITEALDQLAKPGRADGFAPWQFAAFAAFLDATQRQGLSFDQFAATAGPSLQPTLRPLEKLFSEARLVAGREQDPEPDRLAAIRLLGRFSAQRGADLAQLTGLLGPEHSVIIQRAAVTALARLNDGAAAEALLSGWNRHSPGLREEVLAALFSRPQWVKLLLAQIENEKVVARQISPAWRQKLLKHSDHSIRERATRIFSATRPDRQALLKEYAEVSRLEGNANRG
ncbi:MAG TPA: PVC-type heme-binding CxxCH protein, partial [Candidatus Binatia bacterium]|nr:PVC-type heme-binding CxxCH protein [Candidatus Binatia bacterium]